MPFEIRHVLTSEAAVGAPAVVENAVELLSVFLGRHFFLQWEKEEPEGWQRWLWQEGGEGPAIELMHWQEFNLWWVVLFGADAEACEQLYDGLAELLQFEDFSALSLALAGELEIDRLRRACLQTAPWQRDELHTLLTRALLSGDSALRQAAGQLVVLLKPPRMGLALKAAAEVEANPHIRAALQWALGFYEPPPPDPSRE